MKKALKQLYNGILKENPIFVLMLGMCPALATTTSAANGLAMGLVTTIVLVLSNLFISLLRKLIPEKLRIPAFIIVIASLVTMIQMLVQALFPSLAEGLGLYIPLITVSCILLGRAEAFAYRNDPLSSVFDGLGTGLGFTIGLTVIGIVREIIGAGTFFGLRILPAFYEPFAIFLLPAGAFFVLASLAALRNRFSVKEASGIEEGEKLICGGNCKACSDYKCVENREAIARENERIIEEARLEREAKARQLAALKAEEENRKAAAALAPTEESFRRKPQTKKTEQKKIELAAETEVKSQPETKASEESDKKEEDQNA